MTAFFVLILAQMNQKLWFASWQKLTTDVQTLIDNKAPINWQNEDGSTPLHGASGEGNSSIVMLLLEHKASINIRDEKGDTPLLWAAYWGHMPIVRALIEAGSDIGIRGEEAKTAAEWAKEKENDVVAKYLTDEAPLIRFRPSARDESGYLCRANGRSLRAMKRDLEESGILVNHILYRLKSFCTGKRR